MALDRQTARLSKILVDSEGTTFDQAKARLRALILEIVVGRDATPLAAHVAILTAVSVGSRTFVGGVRLLGATDLALNSARPVDCSSEIDVWPAVPGEEVPRFAEIFLPGAI